MTEPQLKKPRYSHLSPPDGFKHIVSKPKSQQKITAPKFTSAFDAPSNTGSNLHSRPNLLPGKLNVGTRALPRCSAPLKVLKPPMLLLGDKETTEDDHDHIRLMDLQQLRENILSDNLFSPCLSLPPAKSTSSAMANISLSTLPVYGYLPKSEAKNVLNDMRTISTTHIALATDLTRENGAAEVASIFLQDQHSDVVPSDSDSECLNMERSVKMSPEKAGTTRGSKVIRKGLAARAFAVYTESRMAMSLWKKEIELHSRRRSTPDLTMLIVKILHAPAPLRLTHAEAKPDSTTVFALCIRPSKNSSKKELLRVLFSYASVESSGSSCIAPQFAEGSVAHIWLPWLELSLQDMQHLTRLDDTLPTCLPVWLDDSSTLTDLTHLPLSNTVVFSSRFVISPSRGLLECIQ